MDVDRDVETVAVPEQEEEMIDSLFFHCDTNNEGSVKVQTVIQYLTNCLGNENNGPDLTKLYEILEAESSDGVINFTTYRDGVKHWISEIKSRCLHLDGETMFEQGDRQTGLNFADCIERSQYSIEASGVNSSSCPAEHPSYEKTQLREDPDSDAGELLTQIEDLRFQNHRLTEENSNLYGQLESQEEAASGLATQLQGQRLEADTLRKKIKSLQELTDQQAAIMEENEELKSSLASIQQGKRDLDKKLTHLEHEKSGMEQQAKQFETMWQRTQSELDQAQQQLQSLNTSYTQQKMMLQAEDPKDTLAQKEDEIAALKAKLTEASALNEKLQEGKNDIEQRLIKVNSKYLRVQTKVEQLGLTDVSLTEDDHALDFSSSRHTSRAKFSTPCCTRNSICMELRDRLSEDRQLPSPLCEMTEQSAEWPQYRRSVVLPAYMSTWELDLANVSLQEYSTDKLRSRCKSPDFFDRDVEKKLLSFKSLEPLQKELTRQFRVNLDLAERCHKAELRESDLQEMMSDSDRRREEDSIKCRQLEESLESVKALQEGDIKDLWRLVHCPDNSEDSDESQVSSELSASTEQLKIQIRHEIEALRKKLGRREAALGALKSDQPVAWHYNYKGRSCNSPLVDALNIECVKVIHSGGGDRLSEDQLPCIDCQKQDDNHNNNRSVPLPRRHNRVHIAGHPQLWYNSAETYNGDTGGSNPKYSLPLRFTFDHNHVDSLASEDRDTPLAVPLYSMDMSKDSVDKGSQLCRRNSYTEAIENQPTPADDTSGHRYRSYSFQSAIEQGQISPTGPPQTKAQSSSIGDTTPDNESQEFLVCKGTPKYSSTPYQVSKPVVKSVTFSKDSRGLDNGGGEHREPSSIQTSEPVKPTAIFPNKSSLCTSTNLSVLVEEDTNGPTDSCRCESESSPSYLGSSGQATDLSAEVWTLSQTDTDSSGQSTSCSSSRDSGHSSSISCLDTDDHSDLKGVAGTQGLEKRPNSISQTDCLNADSCLSDTSNKSKCDTKPSAETLKQSATSEYRTTVMQTLNSKQGVVDSARDLSPSERILLRFGDKSENKKTSPVSQSSPLKQLSPGTSPRPSEIESDQNGKPKVVKTVAPVQTSKPEDDNVHPDTVEEDTSDKERATIEVSHENSEGVPVDMKGPAGELQKPSVMLHAGRTPATQAGSGSRGGQALVMEEEKEAESAGQGDGPKAVSNLAKIRQSHLAKRRDHLRQNKMPQLSELAEKEGTDDKKEQEVPKVAVEDVSHMSNGDVVMPSIPNSFLKKLGLTSEQSSSDELSEQEIENKFSSLSLAFKTDAQTLEKRLEIQERSRDIAEQNVDKELQGLRNGLATLNQICTDPQVREVLSKIQNHIEILEKSTARVSSRAEVYGAIQQEKRMSRAVDIMVQHVENIRRVHEKEHAELEEARKLLQDSRSLGPSSLDIGGGDMLSRRSASVCPNNMFGGKLAPPGGGTPLPGGVTPSALKAIKLLKASKRRVSEVALPKVLGGIGAPNLHPSSSMDMCYMEARSSRFPLRADTSLEEEEGNLASSVSHFDPESSVTRYVDKDARSRFQAAVASTTIKSAVTNTLRRTSLERQNQVLTVTPSPTPPQVSRDNSADSTSKSVDVQDKEKQKSMEEEAFKKGYEQGLRANLGKDLTGLREQQNHINESLGEIMDTIDNQMDEPKSLKELLREKMNESIPKFQISGWRIRMTMGAFFIAMAFVSVIIALFPVSSAEPLEFIKVDGPLL